MADAMHEAMLDARQEGGSLSSHRGDPRGGVGDGCGRLRRRHRSWRGASRKGAISPRSLGAMALSAVGIAPRQA